MYLIFDNSGILVITRMSDTVISRSAKVGTDKQIMLTHLLFLL